MILLPCCAIALWVFLVFSPSLTLASDSAVDTDFAIMLYEKGQYNEALIEFQRILAINPASQKARAYVELIKWSKDFEEQKGGFVKQASYKLKQPDAPKQLDKPEQATKPKEPAKPKKIETIEEKIAKELDAIERKYQAKSSSAPNNEIKTNKTEKISKTTSDPVVSSEPKKNNLSKPEEKNTASVRNNKTITESKPTAILDSSSKSKELSVSESKEAPNPAASKKIHKTIEADVDVSGEVRIGLGYDAKNNDLLWNRANFDLNEKNWRLISPDQLNKRMNTYDPGIYDRLSFDIDVNPKDSKLSYHANITIDPWSFTGKTDKLTLRGYALVDTIDLQFLSWGNTGYTVNSNLFTLDYGDIIALPELKVSNSTVPGGMFTSKNVNFFTYPDMHVKKNFWPLRELWVDYQPTDETKIQFFPYGFENKALSSNDPLGLSNNHIWWEESPWLANWTPGHINIWNSPQDFTKGRWNDALAFQTRDSDGKRLTALRGFSLNTTTDDTQIDMVVASPKTLWQDYDEFDAIPGSFRIQKNVSDNFYIGNIENIHLGLINGNIDAYNIVSGYDAGWLINPGLQIKAEYAFSFLEQDRSFENYNTRTDGNAYDLSIVGTTNGIESPDTNYLAIQPEKDEETFFKTQLRMTRMDNGFESTLANYRETKDDQFWSRHITFRDPMNYPGLSYYDIEPFRIGNSIDYGRYVINWRTDSSFWSGRLKGLTDIRNAHATSSNKYIETVARTEWSYQATDKLETRLLLIGHHLPKTTGGVDPYITDANGEPVLNDAIEDGVDPSGYTTSIGLKYDFSKYLSWNGAWEHTNDFAAGVDNFPRGILNDIGTTTYESYDNIYRRTYSYLYDQGNFPLPPYEYHHIFRTGIEITPNDQWNIYLDFARNPYEYAGPIDDNMNHIGLAASYLATKKLGFFAKYTWSRLKNVNDVVYNGSEDIVMKDHHNIFFEAQYLFDEDSKLSFSYGVGPSIYSAYASSTPYMGSTTPTIDTQNIFRLFYKKRF